jgi:hypothetical protein
MIELTEENFYKFALINLKSKYLIESEFKSLLKHIVYIKRLLKKYKDNSKNINVNLLINHFIVLYNEFEQRAASEMLFYQINSLYYPQVKTILVLLNKVKESDEFLINGNNIQIEFIKQDTELETILKKVF